MKAVMPNVCFPSWHGSQVTLTRKKQYPFPISIAAAKEVAAAGKTVFSGLF